MCKRSTIVMFISKPEFTLFSSLIFDKKLTKLFLFLLVLNNHLVGDALSSEKNT